MSTTIHPPAGGGRGRRARLEMVVDRQLSRAGSLGARRAARDASCYVTFIGFPRSGHSMVGSLLDAHPQVVISHELDALRFIDEGLDRWRLFSLILSNSRRTARRGRVQTGYSYAVEGQWQGRWDDMRVIGDKKGGRSSIRFAEDPTLLDRLRATVRLPLRFVLIVRNPYDNIATIAKRDVQERGIEADSALEASLRRYADLCRSVTAMLREVPDEEVLLARHEDYIARPEEELARACMFLGVTAGEDYLRDCAKLLFDAPRRSRDAASWTSAQLAEVKGLIADHAFLDGYSFDR